MLFVVVVVVVAISVFLSGAADAGTYTPDALADKIVKLPGTENLGTLKFNQFSGYLAIPGTSGTNSKKMHYWMVESMSNPSTDPLAFWTNGGPGCSGLIGFMTEMGPFKPNADGSLSLNNFAYNQKTNMVYIESPAGVGFSYSDVDGDYVTGDAQTALDNYNLIQTFLDRFPQFVNNSLYITSESYGGHYMPTLAKQIADENKAGANRKINFKGFAVGNPYTDVYSGTPAMIDTYWGHQLVAKPTYDAYQKECINAIKPNVLDCVKLETDIMNGVGNLNPYALDYPVCTTDSVSKKGRAQRTWLLNFIHGTKTAEQRKLYNVPNVGSYEPCADDYALAYLNRLDVKTAIHVNVKSVWTECSYKISYDYGDSSVSTAPIYNYLIDGGFGLNILVYSGDDDSVCGTIGTQSWIWDLGYEVDGVQWRPYMVNQQTAGFLTKYKNSGLAFLTIHGAGHEVPTYKPEVALDMWNRYINGEFTTPNTVPK